MSRHQNLSGAGRVPHHILDNMLPEGHWGENDFVVSPNNVRLPASAAPSWVAWRTIWHVLQFDITSAEYIHFEMQLPHSREAGTPIEFHVHFVNNNGAIANGEVVAWQLRYTMADIGDTYSDDTTGFCYYTSSGTTAQDTHCVTDELLITPNTVGNSAILKGRLALSVVNSTASTDMSLLSADAHLRISRLGSEDLF